MESLFRCPNCGGTLTNQPGRLVCPAGHSFDVAKEHYVNLLPANQMHSKTPGDDKEMAAARTRFLDGGWYGPLREELCKLVKATNCPSPTLLDAGCGEGWYTAALSRTVAELDGRTAGVDLSKPSVKKAGKRCHDAEIAVASVYHLPLADESVDILVDCFSPLAAEEFRRVLRPEGDFFYVVPGARHLWELKSVLYENPYENTVKTEEYPGFAHRGVTAVEYTFTLTDRQVIADLFRMTPYFWKTPKEGAARLAELDTLTVTAQFHIHAFTRL